MILTQPLGCCLLQTFQSWKVLIEFRGTKLGQHQPSVTEGYFLMTLIKMNY